MSRLTFLSVLALCLLAPACTINPPLHLRMQAETSVELQTEVNLDLLWQADWEAHWSFNWDPAVYGPIGYVEPASMRVHLYALDAQGSPKSHMVNNFHGTSAFVPITVGVYDMLFHNNDSEALLFTDGATLEEIQCSTRIISSGLKESSSVLTIEQKKEQAETKAETDAPGPEPVILMPDPLYSLYKQGVAVTDNIDDYEYIDGRYVLRLGGELLPCTYIHLFQIHLANNYERVVGSEGGAAITGVAAGVNLHTRVSADSTASVPSTVLFDRRADEMAIRFISFGIPGCNPYDAASVAASSSTHFLVVNITYFDGTWRNIRVDVTDALRALPLGGVVSLELDVDDFPPEGAKSGGGFQALIDNWEEIIGGTTIIN